MPEQISKAQRTAALVLWTLGMVLLFLMAVAPARAHEASTIEGEGIAGPPAYRLMMFTPQWATWFDSYDKAACEEAKMDFLRQVAEQGYKVVCIESPPRQ